MRPHTEKLRLEIVDSIGRARELARKVGDEMRRQPAEGGWSAAECIEHLTLTTENYTRKIRQVLEETASRPAGGDERLSWIGRVYLWYIEPPVRRKLTAPTKLLPTAPASREVLLARFEKAHRELLQLVEETDGIDRVRIKLPAPAFKRIRISLLEAFSVLCAHDRRHLWQAERACGAYNPPA